MTVCPFAVWRPVQNHGGRMSAQLGLILHVQQGNNGLSGWFNNPASGASSTFWVSKNGTLEQYVDSDLCAWAQSSGNSTYQSVETEGYTTEPLTAAAEATLARLYAWGAQTYRWPNRLAEAPGQSGFGWHGMGGAAWGGHTGCPGDLRRPRRAPILAVAFGGSPAPTPPPPPASACWPGSGGSDEGAYVAVCTHPSGKRMDLVSVNPDSSVNHSWTDANAVWQFHENLGGVARSVSCCWLDGNRFVVTCHGSNDVPYQRINNNGRWTGWAQIAGVNLKPV